MNITTSRGYTLLELILAMILMVMGVMGVVQAMVMGIATDQVVENRSVAIFLAQEAIEDMRNTSFASVASVTRAQVSGFPDFDRQIVVTGTNPKQVTVTVYWTLKTVEQHLDMVTMRSQLTS